MYADTWTVAGSPVDVDGWISKLDIEISRKTTKSY